MTINKTTTIDLAALLRPFSNEVQRKKSTGELPPLVPEAPIERRLLTRLIKDKIPINVQDTQGKTLLMHACALNAPVLVASLISLRANAALQDKRSVTALEDACFVQGLPQVGNEDDWLSRKKECIQILIQHGASQNEALDCLCRNHFGYQDPLKKSLNEQLVLGHLTKWSQGPLDPAKHKQIKLARYFVEREFPRRKLGGHLAEFGNTSTFHYEKWTTAHAVSLILELETFLPEKLKEHTAAALSIETPIFILEEGSTNDVAKNTLNTVALRIQRLQPTIIMCGWQQHAIALVFYKNRFGICNRGEGMPLEGSLKVYTFQPDNFTTIEARRIVRLGFASADTAIAAFYETLPKTLSATSDKVCKKIQKLFAKPQPFGHCTCASLLEARRLLVLFSHITPNNTFPNRAEKQASQIAASLDVNRRFLFLERYLEFHNKKPTPFFDQALVSHSLTTLKIQPQDVPFFSLDTYPLVKRELAQTA